MPALLRRLSTLDRTALRRMAAFVVLAMQVAIAVSAVWEPRPGVRFGAHAEEQGSRLHPGQHNEESCVVCAARTLAQAPTAPTPEIAFYSPEFAPLSRAEYAPADVRAVSTQSRAPPTV